MDDKSMLKYDIEINIHQQDPYIFSWGLMAENHVSWEYDSQQTVCHNGKFYAYYERMGVVNAMTSSANDGTQWVPVMVSGLPANIILSSLSSVSSDDVSAMYMLSDDGIVWSSVDGQLWSEQEFDYPVRAIYGILPTIESANQVLLMAEVDGELMFATTTDFEQVKLWNKPEEGVPIKDFDAVRIEKETVYGAKYIVMYGGLDEAGNNSKMLWILQEKAGVITAVAHKPEADIVDAELFYYDNKVYLLAFNGEENLFYMSANFGLEWQTGGENQLLPEEFKLRKSTTVITDENNFIWIFGGKFIKNDHIVDVWRGRLNKLAGE